MSESLQLTIEDEVLGMVLAGGTERLARCDAAWWTQTDRRRIVELAQTLGTTDIHILADKLGNDYGTLLAQFVSLSWLDADDSFKWRAQRLKLRYESRAYSRTLDKLRPKKSNGAKLFQ